MSEIENVENHIVETFDKKLDTWIHEFVRDVEAHRLQKTPMTNVITLKYVPDEEGDSIQIEVDSNTVRRTRREMLVLDLDDPAA